MFFAYCLFAEKEPCRLMLDVVNLSMEGNGRAWNREMAEVWMIAVAVEQRSLLQPNRSGGIGTSS